MLGGTFTEFRPSQKIATELPRTTDAPVLIMNADPDDWPATLETDKVSSAYRIKVKTHMLVFQRKGSLRRLALAIIPTRTAPPNPVCWLADVVKGCLPVPRLT